MADTPKMLTDLPHVYAWLEQFRKPDVATCTDVATIQMLAAMGQALQKVVEELLRLQGTTVERTEGS